jgi:cyclophilin family peptidyl-prolyl cis-trans isomerase
MPPHANRSARLLALIALAPSVLSAQARLTRADTVLVRDILTAEDRRDAKSPALARGAVHRDERVRLIARRASGRIADTLFADRYWVPSQPPRYWPDNPWRARYRAMAPYRDACDVVTLGLRDSLWQVRLRAADVVRGSCATDERIVTTLRAWVDSVPADVSRRPMNGVSWHAAAHALVALARLRPDEARPRVTRFMTHPQWHLRMYAARAAGIVSDTGTLRMLARDPNDNVKEAAIDNLARIGGHVFDDVYLQALNAEGAQAVRSAAIALKGSPRADVATQAMAIYDRWKARANQTERDARVALLEAAGRPATETGVTPGPIALPAEAVALALGADIRLRVEMSPASGGGAFIVKLRGDLAPIMASRILQLAREGYYNNGTWHRVEHDFVIQGGAHGDNEYVGHPRFLRDELGTVAHPRGTVGMSTRGHDSGDAQWFINVRANPTLINGFTIFAEVVEGMEVVDQVQEGDAIQRITILAAPDRPAGRS